MSIAVLVLVALLGFCVGYLVCDTSVSWPQRRRGGELDLTGARRLPPPAGRRQVKAPRLFLVPKPREGLGARERDVRRRNGSSFYSAAWLDERQDRGGR